MKNFDFGALFSVVSRVVGFLASLMAFLFFWEMYWHLERTVIIEAKSLEAIEAVQPQEGLQNNADSLSEIPSVISLPLSLGDSRYEDCLKDFGADAHLLEMCVQRIEIGYDYSFSNNMPPVAFYPIATQSLCGDAVCSADEDEYDCPNDCEPAKPALCGNGRCNSDSGDENTREDAQNCSEDCHPAPVVDLGGFCVAIDTLYIAQHVQFIDLMRHKDFDLVRTEVMPDMRRKRTIKICGLQTGSYEVSLRNREMFYQQFADEKLFKALSPANRCWLKSQKTYREIVYFPVVILTKDGHAMPDFDNTCSK